VVVVRGEIGSALSHEIEAEAWRTRLVA